MIHVAKGEKGQSYVQHRTASHVVVCSMGSLRQHRHGNDLMPEFRIKRNQHREIVQKKNQNTPLNLIYVFHLICKEGP